MQTEQDNFTKNLEFDEELIDSSLGEYLIWKNPFTEIKEGLKMKKKDS